MAKQEALSFIEFKKRFSTEEACREHLFGIRWPQGFECTRCGNRKYYYISTRHLFECTQCHYQISVTAGTIMEKTRTPLQTWFWAMYMVSKDKRGLSAMMLSRELEIAYNTAWHMIHNIRKAMGERDDLYKLQGKVEMDETYIGASDTGGKRGRGTTKAKVMVAVSLNAKGQPEYVKMELIDNIKGKTLIEFANRNTLGMNYSTISSDAYHSYKALENVGYKMDSKKFDIKDDTDHLKWLHIIVSNMKAFILGTYHGLDTKHLQSYLNEFCYRFNRRRVCSELFDRIMTASVMQTRITYTELTA